jgi:hypothetical protein
MHKALNSILNTTKRKRKKKYREQLRIFMARHGGPVCNPS